MGIDSILQQNMQGAGLAGIDRLAGNAMFPQSQMDKTQYSVSSQMPTSAEVVNSGYEPKNNAYTGMPMQSFAEGGIATLKYEDGGNVEAAPQNDPTFGNSDLSNLSYEALSNSNKIHDLNALKEADPKQYKLELMNALGQSLKDQYNANENYEPTWKQFSELKEVDPAQWNRNQLSWLGHQQGWQIGQNTSERNEAGMPVIQDQIEQSKKAGLGEDEINDILGNSSQSANIQNQNRIIRQQQAGGGHMGMTTQDYLTMAAILAAPAAAAYFAPMAAGAAGAAGATGAVGATGAAAAASTTPAWLVAAGKGAAIGAGMGGGSAALTGGNIGQGIIRGGITGAVGGGAGSAMGGGLMGNMAGGALAGGTGSALRGGNVAQGAGMGALGGAISTGIGGLDAPDAVKTGLNMFGKPLIMSQVGSAMGGGQAPQGGIPGSTGGYETSPTGGVYNAFNPGVNTGAGVTGLTGLGVNTPQGTNPFSAQYAVPGIQLSKLSDFNGYADGGEIEGSGIASLGSYSDGGHLLKGPGDGMSDDIPAKIGNAQPARLADGEFVVPADVVSHLGNGSTDAGAKQLYKMMDKIRHARTGNKKQGKQINPDKYLP
jgi:hypothetical protein